MSATIKGTDFVRRIFLHLTSNPQLVVFPNTTTQKIYNAKITHFEMTPAVGSSARYYQLDFGDAVAQEDNVVVGCKLGMVQVHPSVLPTKLNVPVKFRANDLPQSFLLKIYEPGIMPALASFTADGCQLSIEYSIKEN
jgi:hypothetical protein